MTSGRVRRVGGGPAVSQRALLAVVITAVLGALLLAIGLRGKGSPSQPSAPPSAAPSGAAAPGRSQPAALPVALAAGRVAGHARDSRGQPVRAVIHLTALSSSGGSALGGTSADRLLPGAATGALEVHAAAKPADASGSFEFVGLPPGRYAVSGAAPGFAAAYAGPFDVHPDRETQVELSFGGHGVLLSGSVLDADGGPIPGAILIADGKPLEQASEGSRRAFPFESDGVGKFSMELRAGRYRLRVAADGYAPAEFWVDLTTHLQRNFLLERAGSIAGRVSAGGEEGREGEGSGGESPVAGATVELLITGPYRIRAGAGDPRGPALVAEQASGEDGRFRFTGVSAGNYIIVAREGNRVGQRTEVVTVEPGSDVDGADVHLGAGVRVRGAVVTEHGAPVAGARVNSVALGFNPHVVRSSDSDAEGAFTLEGLMPGAYRLDVRASGRGSAMKELNVEGDTDGVELRLPADTRIEGRVSSPDGGPAANASVTVWNSPVEQPEEKERTSRSASSAEDGTFTVDGLMPGYVWVEAADGQAVASLGPEPLRAGESRRVQLRLGEGTRISGRVVWTGGGPAPNVLVRCKGRLIDRSARADDQGEYACEGLLPDEYGVVALRNLASEPWYLAQIDHNVERYGGRRVQLTPERSVDGVDLRLARDDQSITGAVLQSDGTPAGNVAVYASRESLGVSHHATNARAVDGRAVSYDDGTFQIDGLSDGTYQLRAQAIDGEGREANVPVGSDVSIRLKRTGRLRGVVLDEQREPVAKFTIHAYAQGQSGESYDDVIARSEGPAIATQSVFDEGGNFEIAGLRAGEYELVATSGDGRTGQVSARVADGESQSGIEIVARAGGDVTGRVVDHDTGQPLLGARVDAQIAERRIGAITKEGGVFTLTGAAPGQAVRLQVSASGYIGDVHTARTPSGVGGELGVIQLLQGRWTQPMSPRFFDWQLEGRVTGSVIIGVRPGSRPAQLGIVPGATVLKVGERDARGLGPASVGFLGSVAASGAPVVLQLPDGSVRAFEL